MNLTANIAQDSFWIKHAADSLEGLAEASPAPGIKVADFGSGAGIPGIFWALARPDISVDSYEKVGKKIEFQDYARIALGLKNFKAWRANVADPHPNNGTTDLVITRAFTATKQLLELSRPFLKPGGRALLWKGHQENPQLSDCPSDFQLMLDKNYSLDGGKFLGRFHCYTFCAPSPDAKPSSGKHET